MVIGIFSQGFSPRTPEVYFPGFTDNQLREGVLQTCLLPYHVRESEKWFGRGNILFVRIQDEESPSLRSLLEQSLFEARDSLVTPFCLACGESVESCLFYAEAALFLEYDGAIMDGEEMSRLRGKVAKAYPNWDIGNHAPPLVSAILRGDFIQAKIIAEYFMVSHIFRDAGTFAALRQRLRSVLLICWVLVSKDPWEKAKPLMDKYDALFQRIDEGKTLNQILSLIRDFFIMIDKYAEPLKTINTNRRSFQQILDYINDNYYSPLICETQICDKFGISVSLLSHNIKEQLGMSFTTLIQSLRTEKAKELLLSTNRGIEVIAREVGYSGSDSMLKLFKRLVGMSPSQYRSEYLKIQSDNAG